LRTKKHSPADVSAGVPPSPTPRLLIGIAATLLTVAVFSLWSLQQLSGLRDLQTNIIDRNRRESLQLIRIQNDLNVLGLAMRDMVEDRDGYGMQAWRGERNRSSRPPRPARRSAPGRC
jgi:hypothetical protein